MLKEAFYKLFLTYLSDESRIEEFWIHLSTEYSNPSRAYHNLTHLEHLLNALGKMRGQFDDFDAVLFALFYHDLIYNPMRNDNEEQSEKVAKDLLFKISVPDAIIEKTSQIILATKSHSHSTDEMVNIFTDADLSILGSPWVEYNAYSRAIRQEYSLVPDPIYKAGRMAVLERFLAMPAVFKTRFFKNLEESAKKNMRAELKSLQSN